MDYFGSRRQRLQTALGNQLDALAISNPVNVTYLTGFSGDSSWLLLLPKRAILVSDGRYTVQIAEECPGLETVIRLPQKNIYQAVAETVNGLGVRNVGFEGWHISTAELQTLKDLTKTVNWTPQEKLVEKLRMVKDESELAQLRQAVWIAEKAYGMFRAFFQNHDSEKFLSDAMEGYVRRAGGTCTSFPTIVAVGDRSALPHAPPTNRTVPEAGFLLLDWGARGEFYHSDLTRMLALKSGAKKVESQLEKIYTVVLQAQERAIAAVRPGAKARDVDAAARGFITENGYGPNFNHGLGHGLGLQIHEGPNIRSSSDDVLEAGMVFTIEPGVYLPGWGGVRIEDDVLVTPDGYEVLTSVPKTFDSIFV
ncbi:MAG TPA: Xaa-Pro peptidase family protein [Gemmataceae bacterium]|nr:Xaa-Pro peptidase family protein [Gemmataceae bacterium]